MSRLLVFLLLTLSHYIFCEEITVQYDLNLPDYQLVNVTTVTKGLATPIGVAIGTYQGQNGLFVTSFSESLIRFITTTDSCESRGNCASVVVAGSGASGIADGAFLSATFFDPSRILYVEELNVLLVTDRSSGYVRYLTFHDNQVRTMRTTEFGLPVVLVGNAVSDSFPEMDVKRYHNYFYLSDSRYVYNITGADGTLNGALDNGILTQYTALKKWQVANDYDISTKKVYISSIEIDSKRQVIYVAYTFTRSAIVQMPINCRGVSDITILSTDGVAYNIPQTYPKPRNGNIFSTTISGYALFTFPMSMHYDSSDDILYWTEAYAHLATGSSSGALGALAVRRLKFSTFEVDYYAGDVGTFRSVVGKTVGYKDGPVDKAVFRLPTSIAFYSNRGIWGTGPLMYICDNGNGAIRRVATVVSTKPPTVAPSISLRPTVKPTISLPPTSLPSRTPTFSPTFIPSGFPTTPLPSSEPTSSPPSLSPTSLPTGIPTSVPTISQAPTLFLAPTVSPTELDGDCLEIMLIDEFGDGWDGLWLYINHTGYESAEYRPVHNDPRHPPPAVGDEGVYFSSSTHAPSYESNPLLVTVCASLHQDRYRDRGHYTLEIRHDPTSRNNWEILWQVSTLTKDYNDWVYGNHRTKVEYQFGDDGYFHLDKVDHPLEHPNECSKCTPPPPPPPPQEKKEKDNGDDDDEDDDNSNKENKNNSKVSKESPPPPPPIIETHPVSFELGDTEGDGWFSNWLGTKYSISDKSKTKLVDSGSICDLSDKESCQVKLPDGDYYFRVGGAADENRDEVTWKFCDQEGGAMQELSFAIVRGKCVVGHKSEAVQMIGAKEQTTLTLRGEVLLENAFSNDLSTPETRIFEQVIAAELGVDDEEVMVISVCETRPGIFCSDDDDGGHKLAKLKPQSQAQSQSRWGSGDSHRALSPTYVLDVVFLVTIVAEKYNKVGSQYHAMKDLVSDKENIFDKSISSGQLQLNLRASEHESLAYVRLKHYIPLKHTDLSYRFVSLTNSPTPLPHSDQLNIQHVILNETLEQGALLITPLLLVGLALLGVALVVRRDRLTRQQQQQQLQQEALLLQHQQQEGAGERASLKASEQIKTSYLSPSSLLPSSDLNPEEGDDEINFELRSDLSIIPSHNSSRSRYRPKEGGSLSHDDHIPMLNIRANRTSMFHEQELGGREPVSDSIIPPVRREPISPV